MRQPCGLSSLPTAPSVLERALGSAACHTSLHPGSRPHANAAPAAKLASSTIGIHCRHSDDPF